MARTLLFTLPIGCQQIPVSEYRQTDSGHNIPDFVREVDVFLNPDLEVDGGPVHGLATDVQRMYGAEPEDRSYIDLREWDLGVLVHEILHIALTPILDAPTPVERYEASNHGHWIVVPVEMAIAPLIHILAAEDAKRSQAIEDRAILAADPVSLADVLSINPLCLERNPDLSEYAATCCRFPKSCSPYNRDNEAAR